MGSTIAFFLTHTGCGDRFNFKVMAKKGATDCWIFSADSLSVSSDFMTHHMHGLDGAPSPTPFPSVCVCVCVTDSGMYLREMIDDGRIP